MQPGIARFFSSFCNFLPFSLYLIQPVFCLWEGVATEEELRKGERTRKKINAARRKEEAEAMMKVDDSFEVQEKETGVRKRTDRRRARVNQTQT